MRTFRPGEEIVEGYRVVRKLGSGAYGVVYECSAPGGASAALKVIDIGLRPDTLKELRGIQRVKGIREAHLVHVTAIWLLDERGVPLPESHLNQLDAKPLRKSVLATLQTPPNSDDPPSMLVIAMTLGRMTLEDRLNECQSHGESGIPEQELLRYMLDAARGIDYLNRPIHDLGGGAGNESVIHCDIKPGNLLLCGDTVQVCDFGIAKALSAGRSTQTQSGYTLAYAPPELFRSQPTTTTDQYSLACTYYQLRTSSLPLAETLTLREIIEAIEKGDLDFSGITGPRELGVLKRATSVDPARRYANCCEFVDALAAAIRSDHEDTAEARREKRRRRARAILRATMLLAAIGAAGGVAWNWRQIRAVLEPLIPVPPVPVVDFERELENAKDKFAAGKWADAFQKMRRLENGNEESFTAEQRDKVGRERKHLQTQLMDDATRQGRDEHWEEANARWETLVVDAQTAGEPPPSIGLLELARIAARRGRWDDVRRRLEPLASGSDADLAARDSLLLLEKIAGDAARLCRDEALMRELASLLRRRPDNAAWEWEEIHRLIEASVKLVQSGQEKLTPERFRVFDEELLRGRLKEWNDVQGLKGEWTAKAVTFDVGKLEEFVARLRAVRGRIPAQESLRADCDKLESQVSSLLLPAKLLPGSADAPLADALKNLDQALQQAPLAEANRQFYEPFVRGLWDRCEREVGLDKPPDPVALKRLTDQTRLFGESPLGDELALRARAVSFVTSSLGTQFDFAQQMVIGRELRQRIASLRWSPEFSTLVLAGSIECELAADSGKGLSESELRTARATLASPPKQLGTRARGYVGFVSIRLEEQLGGASRSLADQLRKVFAAKETASPPFPVWLKDHPTRRTAAIELLLKGTEELRNPEAGNLPLDKPYFRQENAKSARDLLRAIAALDPTFANPEFSRLAACAAYYGDGEQAGSATRQWFTRVNPPLRPRPDNELDGRLLYLRWKTNPVRSSPTNASPEERIAAIHECAELVRWWKKFDNGETPKAWLFREAIEPGWATARTWIEKIDKVEDVSTTLSLPKELASQAALRDDLAILAKTAAWLIENDFDTRAEKFPDGSDAVVRFVYFRYRLANALSSNSDAEALLGEGNSLWEWLNRKILPSHPRAVQELKRIGDETKKLGTTGSIASDALIGAATLLETRAVFDPVARRKGLEAAKDTFDRLLRTTNLDPELNARLRYLRGTTQVELAFFSPLAARASLLQAAIEDGKAVRKIRFASYQDHASIVIGNASEDLAFYVYDANNRVAEADRYFNDALENFRDEEVKRSSNPLAGRVAFGRTLFRWSLSLFRRSEEDKVQAFQRLNQAIEELRQVAGNGHPPYSALQLEANLFLARAHMEMYRHQPAGERDKALAEAERLVQLVADAKQGEHSAHAYSIKGQLALARRDVSEAVRSYRKILDLQQDSQEATVSWHVFYQAALIVGELSKNDPSILGAFAKEAAQLGQRDAAVREYAILLCLALLEPWRFSVIDLNTSAPKADALELANLAVQLAAQTRNASLRTWTRCHQLCLRALELSADKDPTDREQRSRDLAQGFEEVAAGLQDLQELESLLDTAPNGIEDKTRSPDLTYTFARNYAVIAQVGYSGRPTDLDRAVKVLKGLMSYSPEVKHKQRIETLVNDLLSIRDRR